MTVTVVSAITGLMGLWKCTRIVVSKYKLDSSVTSVTVPASKLLWPFIVQNAEGELLPKQI